VLHLSGVPFDLLNKPQLPDIAPARVSETIQHAIYRGLFAPIAFLGGLVALAYRHMRAEPARVGEREAGAREAETEADAAADSKRDSKRDTKDGGEP
jgi:hypothetical protein